MSFVSPSVVLVSMTVVALATLWFRLAYYKSMVLGSFPRGAGGGKRAGADAEGGLLSEDLVHHAIILAYGTAAYCFYHSARDQPGYLPRRWCPDKRSVEKVLEYCKVCKGYKAPRAHHCRRCGFCVKRMDHHCGFLGNCVGMYNHAHFVYFLSTYWCATALSIYVLGTVLYEGYEVQGLRIFGAFFWDGGGSPANFRSAQIYAASLALLLAGAVLLMLTALLLVQARNLATNVTVLERSTFAEAQTAGRIVINPYNLGPCSNFRQLMLFRRMSGVDWPLRRGAQKYALVEEQRRQKEELSSGKRGKRMRVVKSYRGTVLPVSHGCGAVVDTPLAFESRLDVKPGEEVIMSRQTGHWAYGHKRGTSESGWMPKDCVQEVEQPYPQPQQLMAQRQEAPHISVPQGVFNQQRQPRRERQSLQGPRHHHYHLDKSRTRLPSGWRKENTSFFHTPLQQPSHHHHHPEQSQHFQGPY